MDTTSPDNLPVTTTAVVSPTSAPEVRATTIPTASPSAVPAENLLLQLPGIAEIRLLTPEDGNGKRPLLSWEAVEEATYYSLVVFEETGDPYWAWITEDSSVYVAGTEEPLPEDREGPIILPGMTWMVTAYASDGVPIAAGGPRPIGP